MAEKKGQRKKEGAIPSSDQRIDVAGTVKPGFYSSEGSYVFLSGGRWERSNRAGK